MEKEQIPEKCDGCVNYNVKYGYCAARLFFGNDHWCEYKPLEEVNKKNTACNRK